MTRRHTKFGEARFGEAVSKAVLTLNDYQVQAADRVGRLQHWELSSLEADSLLLRSFEQGIVSSRLLPDVIHAWRQPEYPEFEARTGWSLLQAFTGCLKERQRLNPQEAAKQTIDLQRLLCPPLPAAALPAPSDWVFGF